MKSESITLILFCAVGLGSLATTCLYSQDVPSKAESAAGVRLIASTSKTNYAAGERVEMNLVITNGGSQVFAFQISAYPDSEYKYRVIGLEDKVETQRTRCGHYLLETAFQWNKYAPVDLQPLATYTNRTIIVNQLFDVTVPQEYEITVSRGNLRSNPVRFVVNHR